MATKKSNKKVVTKNFKKAAPKTTTKPAPKTEAKDKGKKKIVVKAKPLNVDNRTYTEFIKAAKKAGSLDKANIDNVHKAVVKAGHNTKREYTSTRANRVRNVIECLKAQGQNIKL